MRPADAVCGKIIFSGGYDAGVEASGGKLPAEQRLAALSKYGDNLILFQASRLENCDAMELNRLLNENDIAGIFLHATDFNHAPALLDTVRSRIPVEASLIVFPVTPGIFTGITIQDSTFTLRSKSTPPQSHWTGAEYGIINQLGDSGKDILINCKGISPENKPLLQKKSR